MAHRLNIIVRLQRRMLEIVGTGLPLITKLRDDADLVGLAHLRGEMVDSIGAYCRHVSELQDGSAAPADQSQALLVGCNDLQAAYEKFRARWVHRDGIDHWQEYRLSAVVMMKQVRAVVQNAEALGHGTSEGTYRRTSHT